MNRKFDSKEFREGWLEAQVKRFVAAQLRAIRGDESQSAFGKRIGKPQNVVSRLENPDYGNMSVQTLLDIALKLDIGLLVKFVPFSRILSEAESITIGDLAPLDYITESKSKRISPAAYEHVSMMPPPEQQESPQSRNRSSSLSEKLQRDMEDKFPSLQRGQPRRGLLSIEEVRP